MSASGFEKKRAARRENSASACIKVTALFLILLILSNPLANVVQKKLTADGMGAASLNFLTYALVVAVSAFFAGLDEVGFTRGLFALCALCGFLGASGNFFLIRALELDDLSVLGPINSYKAVAGLVFGFFILGEVPTLRGLFGIAAIIAGSYFVVESSGKFNPKIFLSRGIRYRIYALLFAAAEAVFLKRVIAESSAEFAFFAWAAFGAVFALPIVFFVNFTRGGRIKMPENPQTAAAPILHGVLLRRVAMLVGVAFFAGLMQFSTNVVFVRMNVGYALALFQLSGVVSVVFGFVFFREQNILRKLFGSLIMSIGAAFIVF